MTLVRSRAAAIGATAILASAITWLVADATLASASKSMTYRLRVGDFVSIPALDWTCWENTLKPRGSGPVFLDCDTNDKPISDVAIYARQIFVRAALEPAACPSAAAICNFGAPSRPTRLAKGRYRFVFSHD